MRFLLILLYLSLVCAVFDPYQDSTRHEIVWPGSIAESSLPQTDSFIIRTAQKEQYRCFIPEKNSNNGAGDDSKAGTTGPDPESLLQNLYSHKDCSYRLESYWNYELCHGRYMKQYHEDPGSDGKKGKGSGKYTEYYLGYMKKKEVTPLEPPPATAEEEKIPTMIIEEKQHPYYAVDYVDGTPCDLGGDGRRTRVLYVCYEHGRNEIVLFRETSTCEYEAVVETPYLCQNSAYRIKEDPVHNIECRSLDNSPAFPRLYGEHVAAEMADAGDDVTAQPDTSEASPSHVEPARPDAGPIVRQFLEGTYCLRGGRGWWKYEFCYQRYVKQYHADRNGQTDVFLGYWNEQTHLDWFRQKEKRKRMSDKHVMHYYSKGDKCDLTKRPRDVQVKLRCAREGSASQVTVYLEEPSPCQYVLTVETMLLCSLIETVDQDGLFVLE